VPTTVCAISIRAAVWSIFNQPNENVAFSNIEQESFGTRSIDPSNPSWRRKKKHPTDGAQPQFSKFQLLCLSNANGAD
jgi:hypothetical protein